MTALTDLEFRVIDELYFVTSFDGLLDALNENPEAITEVLKGLLEKKLLTQLVFDRVLKDYRKLEAPDFSAIQHSYFVASKEGLLTHNSRI